MTYAQRIALAVTLMALGLVIWPLFLLGGVIAWSVYSDIRDEPEKKKQEEEAKEILDRTISVDAMRRTCESPAEEAFFDAMVSAHKMKASSGCIAGVGIKLRTQVGLGRFHIGRNSAWHQYRGDFLIDERLVVEIDGAAWHGSTEAIARDAERDHVISGQGYTVLRIPAKVVFSSPTTAVKMVDNARSGLIRNKTEPTNKHVSKAALAGSIVNKIASAPAAAANFLDELERLTENARKENELTKQVDAVLFEITDRAAVESAMLRVALAHAKRAVTLKKHGIGSVSGSIADRVYDIEIGNISSSHKTRAYNLKVDDMPCFGDKFHHDDPVVQQRISQTVKHMSESRDNLVERVFREIESDSWLRKEFEGWLRDRHCHDYFVFIGKLRRL